MRISAALVAVTGAFLIGCGGATDLGSNPPPAPPPPPPAPNSVTVSSNQFSPTPLTVTKGTTVTWTWQAGIHNLTFEDNQSNSGDRSSGSHDRTFANAGTFRYRCTNHSSDFNAGMVGSVVVQ